MQRGWQILRAFRSDSREWPSRMGVGGGDSVGFETVEVEVDAGILNGLGVGADGERNFIICS